MQQSAAVQSHAGLLEAPSSISETSRIPFPVVARQHAEASTERYGQRRYSGACVGVDCQRHGRSEYHAAGGAYASRGYFCARTSAPPPLPNPLARASSGYNSNVHGSNLEKGEVHALA